MLSIIIPTLNEADRIGGLLDDLRGGTQIELIVADGGSTDDTVSLARARGARIVVAEPGRAGQMNAGAEAAGGDALLFLHADTRLPRGYRDLILGALADERTAGGAFRLALAAKGCAFRFLETTTNFRAGRLGVIFGDQAIFARADLFSRVGGFPDQPIMEDYEFVRRLRRVGKVVLLPQRAVTSVRRWREAGMVWTSLLNVVITWAYVLGVSPGTLAGWYRRSDGAQASPRPR